MHSNKKVLITHPRDFFFTSDMIFSGTIRRGGQCSPTPLPVWIKIKNTVYSFATNDMTLNWNLQTIRSLQFSVNLFTERSKNVSTCYSFRKAVFIIIFLFRGISEK